MAAKNKREAKEKANEAVNAWSVGLAATAWIPGSGYVMTAGDIMMVIQVGKIYDVDMDETAAATVLTGIAAPLVGRTVAYGLLDCIPIAGWIVKSAVSVGVSITVGKTVIAYFEDCSPLPE
ncbi:MAG: hypothetical protein MUE81_10960 [Thermoflexibacter sp.]|jgi:uncharacterized protein (DUF697 family)|nr:hypothetical protein [Thermoflexibacter sp.]